ncbi:MAG: TonB-dependent receptor, partial [Sphingomonas bacterium]|nr:TonB-dependent receptor [Sphingomonas bacterium]
MTEFCGPSRRRRRAAFLIGASSIFALMTAAPAFAQTTTPDSTTPAPSAATPVQPADNQTENDGGIPDIIVTAQRRNESLQKVPIAISAIPEDQLISRGIRQTEDLNLVVPGLNTQRVGGTGVFFLRGVGTGSLSPCVEPPVAYYVDSVYMPSPLANTGTFIDVERIEVLKGPQGTLFGRNSMGGLVNVITKDPSDTLAGHIKAGYGNYNTMEGDLYVTGPITTNLAVDFAAYGYDQQDGWGHNLTLNIPANYRKEYMFRSKLQWKPTDRTTVTLSGDYDWYRIDIGASASILPGLPPPPASQPLSTFRGSIYDSIANLKSYGDTYNWGTYLRINQDLGNDIQLVNTANYRSTIRFDQLDNDYTPYTISHSQFRDVTLSYADELQLLGGKESGLQWQTGLYYFHKTTGYRPQLLFGSAFGAAPGAFRRNTSDQRLDSYSGYAQVTFPVFSDATKVTLGGRYTTDHKQFTGRIDNQAGLVATVADKKNDSKFTYRVALSQQFSPTVMAYASVSTGFKGGYWNPSNPLAPSVRPETVTDYEGGLKTDLFDHKLRFNIGGFYYDYKDLQLTQVLVTGLFTANAAKAEVYGLEIEGEARPANNFTITYGVALTHSRYVSYPNATSYVTSPVNGTGVGTPINNTGHNLQRTPKATANIGIDYVIPSSVGDFGVNANYAYNDGFFFEPDNQMRQAAYSLVNGELRWTPKGERFVVRAWI